MSNNNNFGSLLNSYIIAKQIKKGDLAKQIGVSGGYLSQILQDKESPPPFATCEKIAKHLQLTQEESWALFQSAVRERTASKDKAFFNILGQPTFFKDPEKESLSIPLIDWPETPVTFPIPDAIIKQRLVIPGKRKGNLFAIEFDSIGENLTEFQYGDLLVLDTQFKDLKSGDFVLVKLNNTVCVKRYDFIQMDQKIWVQFYPMPKGNNTLYDPLDKEAPFTILGKVLKIIKSL